MEVVGLDNYYGVHPYDYIRIPPSRTKVYSKMEQPNPYSISHYSHPQHWLTQSNQPPHFICDGCRRPGYGSRYRCNLCDFDLHLYCATCPRTVFFFMHQHPLQLKIPNHRDWSFTCNVCNLPIHGSIFFCCTNCNFHAHPICTQIPQRVVGDLVHPFHELEYTQKDNGRGICNGCSRICVGWRYRCVQAGCTGRVQFHRECLRGPPPPPPPPPPLPPPIHVGHIVPSQRIRWGALLSYIRHGFDIINIIAAIFGIDLGFLF